MTRIFLLFSIIIGTSACSTSQPITSSSALEGLSEVYDKGAVDDPPELIGGHMKLLGRISYPRSCRRRGGEGLVVVEFVVDKQGNIVEPLTYQGIDRSCDKAVIRAMTKHARFTPGYLDGRAVNVKMIFTFNFKLY